MSANKRIRIAVDAMGGDFAPDEIVKGAVLAAEKNDVEVILVGPTDIVAAELAKYNASHLPIRCVQPYRSHSRQCYPVSGYDRRDRPSRNRWGYL